MNYKKNRLNLEMNTSMGALDQMEFFFKPYNNSRIYCSIYFEGFIDFENFKKAAALSMGIVPALRSKLVDSSFYLHWESTDIDISKIVTLIHISNIKIGINTFIRQNIDEYKGPQIMIQVLRSLDSDTLCFMVNHMICDTVGFKQYLYMLSSIYTDITNHRDYKKEFKNANIINLPEIFKSLSPKEKLQLFFMSYENYNNTLRFPLEGSLTPSIVTYRLPPTRFEKLKSYAKSLNATINDVVMAAFFRTLYKMLKLKSDKSISIPCMIDLRKFLKHKDSQSICNLASTIICTIKPYMGEGFDETVLKVKHDMDEKKNSFSGLSGLLPFNMIIKCLPYKLLKKILSKIFINPKISLTNIGIIDKNKLKFNTLKVTDAFMTGAIKYAPYFQLSLSSFGNLLTFSVNIFGSSNDIKIINTFFSIFDNEFPV